MAHEVETIMYTGRTPWHGLGTYVGDEAVDARTALAAAGLDWTASLKPLWAGSEEDDEWVAVDCRRAVVRDTDWRVLGVVGTSYDVFQPYEAFAWLDSLVDEGSLRYHTAGSLQDGRRIWCLAKVPGDFEAVPGDVVRNYLLISTGYDGRTATRVDVTPVRVVCANTIRLAMSRSLRSVSVAHTANQRDRLSAAARALQIGVSNAERFAELAKALAKRTLTDEEVEDFASATVPQAEKDAGPTKRQQEVRARIKELTYDGVGAEYARGTAWQALNAVTQYVGHERRAKSDEQRWRSVHSGAGDAMNQRALQYVQRLVA